MSATWHLPDSTRRPLLGFAIEVDLLHPETDQIDIGVGLDPPVFLAFDVDLISQTLGVDVAVQSIVGFDPAREGGLAVADGVLVSGATRPGGAWSDRDRSS
jgi:hypothetical protein